WALALLSMCVASVTRDLRPEILFNDVHDSDSHEIARLRTARVADVHATIDLERLERGATCGPALARHCRRVIHVATGETVDQHIDLPADPALVALLCDRLLELHHALQPLALHRRIHLISHLRGGRTL